MTKVGLIITFFSYTWIYTRFISKIDKNDLKFREALNTSSLSMLVCYIYNEIQSLINPGDGVPRTNMFKI